MNEEKLSIEREILELLRRRNEFYAFFDRNIPKIRKTDAFIFSKDEKLDAKEVYAHFYRLDYQSRKLRRLLAKAYKIDLE